MPWMLIHTHISAFVCTCGYSYKYTSRPLMTPPKCSTPVVRSASEETHVAGSFLEGPRYRNHRWDMWQDLSPMYAYTYTYIHAHNMMHLCLNMAIVLYVEAECTVDSLQPTWACVVGACRASGPWWLALSSERWGGTQKADVIYGCFFKLGVLFALVLVTRAVSFWGLHQVP